MKIYRVLFFPVLFTGLFFMLHGTARPEPGISGVLDTTVLVYPANEEDPSKTETACRIHESVIVDMEFNSMFSFNAFSRFTYGSNKYEYPDYVDFNFYYGYFTCVINNNFMLQAGRMMDVNNLVFTGYDGLDFQYAFDASGNRFSFDFYGGMVVNDDYLDWDSMEGLNCYDLRNSFITEREGDYICGMKFISFIKDIMLLGVNYQALFNSDDLTEHYFSLDVDTDFSKLIKLYGYSTFDFVDMLPVTSMAGAQFTIRNDLYLTLNYEFSRPVYPKNSYFWAYFNSYGAQEAGVTILYMITQSMIVDARYSILFYETETDPGHQITAGFEHRKLFNSRLKINAEYLTGPEGNKATILGTFAKHIYIFDIIIGTGAVFYTESDTSDNYETGVFASAGTDIEVRKDLVLSATMEYYYNRVHDYDLRGYFSMKYFF